MSLDGLITFIALAVASLSVMSQAERGRVLSRGWLFWPTTGACAFLVLYFQFFEFVALPCFGSDKASVCELISLPSDSELPGILSFLIALVWLSFFAVLAFRKKYSDKELESLGRQISRFISEGKFSQASELIEANLERVAITAAEMDWRSKLLSWADGHAIGGENISLVEAGILGAQGEEVFERNQSLYPKFLRPAPQWILNRIMPEDKLPSTMARQILEEISFDLNFSSYLAKVRPEVGIKIIQTRERFINQFAISFFYFMLKDCNSQIFLEKKYLQEAPDLYRGRNTGLLSKYFFVEPGTAARTEVYRFVGEAMLEILREARQTSYSTELNSVESGVWDASNERSTAKCDPLPASLAFFNAVVSYAAVDGTRWHMWLFYVQYFSDHLLELLEPIHDESNIREFPNKLLRDLYDCCDYLGRWLDLSSEDGVAALHRSPEFVNNRHENGNIPKSAALCLGSVISKIIANENVPDEFKIDRLSTVIRQVVRYAESSDMSDWSQVLSACIINRGPLEASIDHIEKLEYLLTQVDPILLCEASDFQKEFDLTRSRLRT